MKNKQIIKRQIFLVVCCLLFFLAVLSGIYLAISNNAQISIKDYKENFSFIKEFFDIFKYTFLTVICGFIPEASIILFFLVAYKGFSIGYTAFAITEEGFLSRVLLNASFIPAEFFLSFFIIFCASYFSSYNASKHHLIHNRQEMKKRNAEVIILIALSFIISFVCALWKIFFSYMLYNH